MTNNNLLIEMGNRITKLRKSKKLSQEALAEKAGVSIQTISSAERGFKALRPQNLLNICIALNTSADYLLTGKTSSSEISEMNKKLKKLTSEQFYLIEEIIDKCIELCDS